MIRTEIHIVFFILIFGVALSVNATPQDDFNRAAYLMGQQEYEEAFEIYQEIEETGYMAGPLYLNMGISLVRMDSLGLAKYYFMRAGEFNQTRARAVDGLNYIDQEVERRSGSIPVLPSASWRDWIQFELGIWNMIIGGIVLFNLGALILGFGWIQPRWKKLMKIIGLPSMLLAVAIIIFGIWLDWHSEDFERGVIVDHEISIFEQPNDNAAEINTAYEGFTVTRNRKKSEDGHDGWSYITLSNGTSGWVPSNSLRTL